MENIDVSIQNHRESAKLFYLLSKKIEAENAGLPHTEKERQRCLQEMSLHNNLAISLLLEKNVYTHHNKEYIDLHFLQTCEVTAFLDICLDNKIVEFRQCLGARQRPTYINLITGRGRNNRNGLAPVKQAAVDYLITKRKLLLYSSDNPGCFIILINADSKLSSELE